MTERSNASEWGRPRGHGGHIAWSAARKAKARAVRRLTRRTRSSRVVELQRQVEELRLVIAALAESVRRFQAQRTQPASVLDELLVALETKPSASEDVVVPQSLIQALLED